MMDSWRKGPLFQCFGLFLLIFLACPVSAEEEIAPTGKPLTLDQCTAIALKYHPSLQASQATVEASKARVEQALAAYYPQVNLNTSYSSSTSNLNATGAQVRGGTYNWTFYDFFATGPTLAVNLYDFGRTPNTVKINRENAKASEEDLITTKQAVVLNVKQAYFGVLQTLRLIKVAEETVNQMKQHLEQARGFYQAGTRPKIDVTKAEVDLANAELGLIRTKNNYQVARVTLNNALGLREDLTFVIEDILDFKPMEINLEEILKSSYAQRPELLQLKARQRSQEANIKLAQSSYYPILSGNASYLNRGDHVDNLYWDLSVGATLSIPLFSGFSSPNQVAEAKANLRNLQAQEENLKLNIRLEAEQAFLGLKEADERIRVAEKAVAQAKENFDLATGRYQVGVGQPLEVTDAEVLLANARANHIQALYDYKVAEARIEKAMGKVR
ncbi:MAG: TolC family protein [Deltaproteobacteria bacterium]|nr:TolC family protein [Deltaproteobacteria bacterium]